jgi:outer membrane immunogenic protein
MLADVAYPLGGIMRRFQVALLAAVAVVGFASVASAADMPAKVPTYTKAPMAPPAYSWTGWYMGLNAGGDWGKSNTSTTVAPGTLSYPPFQVNVINAVVGAPPSTNTSGFTGGVLGGYNYQFGNLLAGVEIDFEYFRSAGSNTVSGNYFGIGTVSVTSSVSTNWLFTARPRLGIVSNNWLFYGTGGLAITQIKAAWNYLETANAITESASASPTKTGWVIGGGIETALPGKMFIGAEYLYVKFGSVSVISTNSFFPTFGGPLANPFSHSADLSANIVRARIGMKF